MAAESGAPLAGCRVTFTGVPSNAGEMARHGDVAWSDPGAVVTPADGSFDISFVPPPPYQHFLDVQCPGRVPRTARWGSFQPGQVDDLGDIALSLGHVVEGRVVEETGAPVAGVHVSTRGLPLPVRHEMGANDTRGGTSDESGAFRFEVPIPAGTWSLDAQARGVKLVSPDSVTVPDSGATAALTVVVRRMPSISGIVVDETGAGVERVYVEAELKKRSGRMAAAWTRADGSFTIYAVDDVLEPVRLTSHETGPCEPMKEPTAPYAWGATDARIELVRALSFELTVVEKGSDAPVEQYSVACVPEQATWSNQREDRLGGRHAGGKVTVDHVWRGKNQLTVHPNDPDLVASAPVEIDAASAPLPPIRVELVRAVKQSVHVVTAAREPVAGSQVELVRLGSEPLDADSFVVDPARGGFSSSTDEEFRPHVLVARSTTDERGLAALPVPPGGAGLGLRASGPRHLTTVVSPLRIPDDRSAVEIVVAAGGRIAGKLHLDGYAPGALFLQFDRPGADGEREAPRTGIGPDGEFESPSLEPGEWSVHLSVDHPYREEHSSMGARLQLEPELARATIAEGQTARLDLDGRAFTAGEISGTILMNGSPLAECRVFLVRAGDRQARFGQYVPDPQGRFEAKGLPPGTWTAGIVVGDYKSREGDRIDSADSFALPPGGAVRREFSFERRRLVLHVLQPDGVTPFASSDVLVEMTTTHEFLPRSTDERGRLVLDPAPSGEVRLRAGELSTDALRITEDRKEAEIDVVLRKR